LALAPAPPSCERVERETGTTRYVEVIAMAIGSGTAIAAGVIGVGLGLVLVWNGATPLSQDRDADGYLMSSPLTIDRSSSAVMANDVGLLRGHYDCAAEETLLLSFATPDDVRIQGLPSGPDALFLGIGPATAVATYLDGVRYDEITDWDCDVDQIEAVAYSDHTGSAAAAVPGSEDFWVASASGTGLQTLDWTIGGGEWAVVIMNADASTGVSADVSFGALAPSGLDTFAWISIGAGLAALVVGGGLLVSGFRRRHGEAQQSAAPQT
jgi:hypothetical protein